MVRLQRLLVSASFLMFLFPMHAQANELVMPGEVISGHAMWEKTCDKCHKKFDKSAQSGLCADCHKEVAKDIAEKRGAHGRHDAMKECRACHPEHKGRNAKIIIADMQKFDHVKTDYLLEGGHADPKVKCEHCHKTGKKYSEAPTICNECHKKGDKHKGLMGSDCEACHTVNSWKKVIYDHNKTSYKLLGKHKAAKCERCHLDDKLKETPRLCNACHKKNDRHKGNFGSKCEDCHIEKNWKEITFDHDKKSIYPLLFKHKQAKCESCHTGELYKNKLQVTCIPCHQKNDKHKGNLGPKCELCHIERDWKEILFDHDKQTKSPLLGKHREAKCAGCHKSNNYKERIPTLCLDCHEKDDKHKRQFGPMCDTCHIEKGWKEIIFNHGEETNYQLMGKHKELKCLSCHKGRVYDNDYFRSDCFYCHEKDDVHKGKDGKKCETCHTEELWKKIIGRAEIK